MNPNTDLPSVAGPKIRFRDARRNPDFTIDQDWASYSPAEHDRWNRLFRRSLAALQNRACDEFLAMIEALSLSDGGIPDMEKLSDRLEKITGWRVVPVVELVPDDVFFNHLANRRFPTGAFIRPEEELDYLQEPDVFHDIFGHVPLLANPVFADFMVAYGTGNEVNPDAYCWRDQGLQLSRRPALQSRALCGRPVWSWPARADSA